MAISKTKYTYPTKSHAMDAAFTNDLAASPEKLEKLGIIVTESFRAGAGGVTVQFALDAGVTQPVTTPSNGTSLQFLQTFLPGVVNILTKVRKADFIAPVSTVGNWHDEEIVLRTMEHTGTPAQYSDYGGIPLASFNETVETRQIIRVEQGIQQTKLADARSAATGTSPQTEKRIALTESFEIFRNDLAFNGFNVGTGKTYGIMNDPLLPAYVTVANGASLDTTWASKTVAEKVADVVSWVAGIDISSGGQIDTTKDALQLVLPLSVKAELFRSDSSFFDGKNLMVWLKETFPNMSIETAPQFDGADGGENVAYLKATSVADSGTDGGQVIDQIVPAKMIALGTEQNVKGVIEGFTAAYAGVFLRRPYGVYRASGI